MEKTVQDNLAIFNGPKVRKDNMPARHSFGNEELESIQEVFQYYKNIDSDIGYQGHFEELYCKNFIHFLGEDGFCDAVNSGTNALYLAVRALNLAEGSHVLVSPVTDPGTLSAIILNKLIPVVVDSMDNSFNIGVQNIKERMTDKTKAIIVVHLGGKASHVDEIVEFAHKKNIFVIEDCSQAHGASYKNKKVGTYGDIGVFSTMFTKNHSTGGAGGLIYTKSFDIYKKLRSHADRGKNFFDSDFDSKDPNGSLFPALNFNQDEISCAIGIASLKKLPKINNERIQFLKKLQSRLLDESKTCKLQDILDEDAPFFWPIEIDINKIKCSKIDFAEALKAEGIGINSHYKFIVSGWKWIKDYLHDDFSPVKAIEYQHKTFNLLFNEKYEQIELDDIVRAIVKVEKFYLNS